MAEGIHRAHLPCAYHRKLFTNYSGIWMIVVVKNLLHALASPQPIPYEQSCISRGMIG